MPLIYSCSGRHARRGRDWPQGGVRGVREQHKNITHITNLFRTRSLECYEILTRSCARTQVHQGRKDGMVEILNPLIALHVVFEREIIQSISCFNDVTRISLASLTHATKKLKSNARIQTIMTKTKLALRARTQVHDCEPDLTTRSCPIERPNPHILCKGAVILTVYPTEKQIPIVVKNNYDPEHPGTTICATVPSETPVTSVTSLSVAKYDERHSAIATNAKPHGRGFPRTTAKEISALIVSGELLGSSVRVLVNCITRS